VSLVDESGDVGAEQVFFLHAVERVEIASCALELSSGNSAISDIRAAHQQAYRLAAKRTGVCGNAISIRFNRLAISSYTCAVHPFSAMRLCPCSSLRREDDVWQTAPGSS